MGSISGFDIANAILGPTFADLYNEDAVAICCLGILQLVLLGYESKRKVPEWLLRIANEVSIGTIYPWVHYVWPTLYFSLRNANVRRWGPLYVDPPANENDHTRYSLMGYTWAFKTWILESFRVTAIRYYDHFNWYPRVAAWNKKKGRFLAEMVISFFDGNIPVARLTPDDYEARSDWWISSRAYFDGFIDQVERVPFDLSRQNMYEIPSDIYRQFAEQQIELKKNKRDVDEIREEMLKLREEMNARPVRQENTAPIIVGQHYGFSDFSQFQSNQGGMSSFKQPNFQTPMRSQPGSSDWQRQMPEQSANHYWQPSSQPGSYYSFGQVPSHMRRPNLQTNIETQHDVADTVDQGDNEAENNVTFLGSHFTGNILFYENVDPAKVRRLHYEDIMQFLNNPYQIYLDCYMKGYIVPVSFWQELAPLLCRPDMQRLPYDTPNGWLAGEHMNSWVELMIRRRPLNANWTVAYTSTISVHPENNQFIIMNDPHVIGTLDGSTRPYPSWNNVDWVFLPIHVVGNHWATGVIHLASSHFYVFDSMYSRGNYDVISKLIECWTPVLNRILEDRGCFNGTRYDQYYFDIITTKFVFTKKSVVGSSIMNAAFAPAIASGIPWAAVLGNHDQESTLSRKGVMKYIVGMKHTLSQFNPSGFDAIDGFGNYNLEVHGVEGSSFMNKSILNLYFLDSGDYSTVPSILGYGWIKPSQQFWFQQTSKKLQKSFKAPGLAYFHIPLPEYANFDSSNFTGVRQEGISSASVNSGFFTTLVGAGDVKAVFTGHDHINDFCGELTGIHLCYAGGFGYHAYGKAGWSRRARVVVVSLEKGSHGDWGAVKSIKTWKRLDDKNLTAIDGQVLWSQHSSGSRRKKPTRRV
ncbi:probable inactive purple acid phosphatase 29 [Tanacetum coccineum]